MTDDNYFKVKYAFMPQWTLQQAAHLLLGHDPDNPAYKIGKNENNQVSILFYWLQTQHQSNRLFSTGFAWKEPHRFSPESLFECMGKRNYDKELHAATQFIWHKQPAAQAGGRVSKIIYLRAAKLIWDKHSDIHIPQMSEHLAVLAEKLNAKYGTALKSLGATTIAGFLKAKSPHEAGAPHKDASTAHNIEWDYVIENM